MDLSYPSFILRKGFLYCIYFLLITTITTFSQKVLDETFGVFSALMTITIIKLILNEIEIILEIICNTIAIQKLQWT